MKIKKNNIIYNLDRYKKIFMNDQILALCLCNEEEEEYGEYEPIYFDTLEELEAAYKNIINYQSNLPAGMTVRDLPEILNLDIDFIRVDKPEEEIDLNNIRLSGLEYSNIQPSVVFQEPMIEAVRGVIREDNTVLSLTEDSHILRSRVEQLERSNEELNSQLNSLQSIIDYLLNKIDRQPDNSIE